MRMVNNELVVIVNKFEYAHSTKITNLQLC